MFVLVAVLIFIIGGAVVYVLTLPDGKVADSYETVSTNEPEVKSEEVPGKTVQPGSYVDYSADAFASATGTRLLFFHASWCPQCRSVDASIEQDGLPDGVTVFKVDYDTNQSLRQKYGVTIQTTFIKVDAAGNRVGSYVAYDEPTFSSVQRELLP